MKKSKRGHIEDAARAMADLNVLAGIVGLLEARALSTEAQSTELRIISICKGASMKAYRRYERSRMAAEVAD